MADLISSTTFGTLSGGAAGAAISSIFYEKTSRNLSELEERLEIIEDLDLDEFKGDIGATGPKGDTGDTGATGDTGTRGSIITSENVDPTMDPIVGNPTPQQYDHHLDTTDMDEIKIYEYNGSMWGLIQTIPSSSGITNIQTQSLLQSSYQFRYPGTTGTTDRPLFVIGAKTTSTSESSVPSNGRSSNTHQGFLSDYDLELAGIALTIKGASTDTATPSIAGPMDITFSLHTWLETTTSEQTFTISIPYGSPGINGPIGGTVSSNTVNSDIKFQTLIPPGGGSSGITIALGELFGLEFKTPAIVGDTLLADVDNMNVKLIFRADPNSILPPLS